MNQGTTVFKVQNHKSIVAASKVVWDEGECPHRVVLRKDRDEYTTHMENLILCGDTFESYGFHWGHYFMLDEARAKEDYLERVKKL